jgi:histidine phosphotransfer protein HptB
VNDANYPLVDRTKLGHTRAELGVNFTRILGYFREDSIKAIAQIEAAINNMDAVALVRPAHTLKGESLQFGLEQLGYTAETIEKAARDAVENRSFPHEMVGKASGLRALLAETLGTLDRDGAATVPASIGMPVRRAVGFGRKSA